MRTSSSYANSNAAAILSLSLFSLLSNSHKILDMVISWILFDSRYNETFPSEFMFVLK